VGVGSLHGFAYQSIAPSSKPTRPACYRPSSQPLQRGPAKAACHTAHVTHHQLSQHPTRNAPTLSPSLQGDALKAPLWDVAALGAAAYPSNAAYVQQYVTNLLTTSFPNLRPQQVQASGRGWVAGNVGAVGGCGPGVCWQLAGS
jgi:hypothetical protein